MKGKINKERQASGTRWAAGGLGDPRGCGLPWVLIQGKVSKGVILPPSLGDAGENLCWCRVMDPRRFLAPRCQPKSRSPVARLDSEISAAADLFKGGAELSAGTCRGVEIPRCHVRCGLLRDADGSRGDFSPSGLPAPMGAAAKEHPWVLCAGWVIQSSFSI